jgi:hypothetical protein
MYTLLSARAEERGFIPGLVQVRAATDSAPKESILIRLFRWPWRESNRCRDAVWQRVATLRIGRGEQTVRLNAHGGCRFIKVRATSVDVHVRRLTLEFSDGSLQDLSIGCLVRGCESRPMSISGRELKGVAMEYKAAGTRGQVEVWTRN